MNKCYILGIYAGFHGVSGTLLENGIPVVAIQLERITGIKRCWLVGQKYNYELACQRVKKDYQGTVSHFKDYFEILIEYILKSAKIKMADIEIVALEKRNLFNSPFDSYIMDPDNELDSFFSQHQIVYVEHHQGHQAQAFYPSPFSEAAILTIDGRSWDKVERIGDHISFTASHGQHPGIHPVVEKPASLTSLYYELSDIFFQERYAEGKMMGLSSLGNVEFASNSKNREQYATYVDHIRKIEQESTPLFNILGASAF